MANRSMRKCSFKKRPGVLCLALAILQFVTLKGVASLDNNGVYISCGRSEDFIDSANRHWSADANLVAGQVYTSETDLQIDGANLDPRIYQSMRFFGAQYGPINSYSIKVDIAGYYLVRLHFAEILLTTTSQRIFHVNLNGVRALEDYTLPALNQADIKEFYIPIMSGKLDLTFVRSVLGDPMINAIQVIPAPGLYGLDPASGPILLNRVRLNCGSEEVYGPDSAGRVWSPDAGYYTPTGDATSAIDETTAQNKGGAVTIKGTESAPYYLPNNIYTTARQVNNIIYSTSDPLIYTIKVQQESRYFMRLHFAELWAGSEGQRQISVSINNKTVTSNLDVYAEAGAEGAFTQNYAIANLIDVSTITIALVASPSLPVPNPMLSALELFQIFNASDALYNETTSLPPAPYVIPSPPRANQVSFLRGIAIGVAVMVGLFAALVALFSPQLWRKHVAYMKEKDLQRASLLDADGNLLDHSGDGSLMNRAGNRMGTRVFSEDELKAATENFSSNNVIGRGGFGQVYKADIGDGVVAAVKKLAIGSQQGEREFMTEVELLSRLHHRNLVNLLGYCEESSSLMLVYEYIPNGTLRDVLKDEERARELSWPARVRVALGAAKGIEYLHRGAIPPVIHRDIKSTNILLDENLQAKVADFGLSRLAGGDTAQRMNITHITTGVKGTLGYLDPLYYRNHQLTDKSDVYSFGVVLLEIITGKMAIWRETNTKSASAQKLSGDTSYMPPTNPFLEDDDEPEDYISTLVEWASPAIESGDMALIAAPELQEIPSEHLPSMLAIARVAASCVKLQPKDRPSMSDVVRELEYCASTLPSASSPPQTSPPRAVPAVQPPSGSRWRLQAPQPLNPVPRGVGLHKPLATLPRVPELASQQTSPVTPSTSGGGSLV